MKKLARKIVLRYLNKMQSHCSHQLVSLGDATDWEVEKLGGDIKFQDICKRYQAIVQAVNVIKYDTDENFNITI